MRIGQNFVPGRGVERSAFGILDARIEIQRGLFRATRVFDAIRAGQRINVFVIEREIARQRNPIERLREFRRRDLPT